MKTLTLGPTLSLEQIEAQAENLPLSASGAFRPKTWRDWLVFMVVSTWVSATIYAYVPPLGVLLELSGNAWAALSAGCGVIGTLLTTWLVKRYEARQAKGQAVADQLKTTIEWAIKERQELYLEAERNFKLILAEKDALIASQRAEIERLRERRR